VKPKDPRRLNPEDSRLLDDELSPAERARVEREQADDPARSHGARDLRAALAAWADDARRAGEAADADATARGVLARIAADPDGRAYAPRRASWSWVAAAAALLALGVGGTWASWPRRAVAPEVPGVATELEQGGLAVLRRIEIEAFAVTSDDGSLEGR
jgi:anti-sigma factor RsiW